MGRSVTDRLRGYCGRVPLGRVVAHHVLRVELPGADYRCVAAKRESCRPCGSLRRGWQPNGLRSAWCRHGSFTSHDLVRGDVHALCASSGGARRPRRGTRWFGPSAILQARAEACSHYSSSVNFNSDDTAACSAAIFNAATTGSRNTSETVIIFPASSLRHSFRLLAASGLSMSCVGCVSDYRK
jgi:hypothetical protein